MEGGDGRPIRGALGVSRGPPFLIALLIFSTFNVQADALVCKDQFTPVPDTTVGSSLVIFNRNVAELEAVGSSLLNLEWLDGAFGTPVLEAGAEADLATQYLGVAIVDAARTMSVSVLKELEGLPDYPDRKETLVLVYSFPVSDGTMTECEARIVFSVQDQNTAAPSVDQTSYTATVREDFPAQYTIPNLQVMATDLDGTSPNNVLVVSIDAECPLTASKASYDAQGGNPVPITFVLTQKLDYDTMDEPAVVTCSVRVSDQGVNPAALDVTLTVEITVEPTNDETPQFDKPIYNSRLEGLEVPPDPITVVLATDADKPPQTLTYSMVISSGDDPAWNGYFSIDPATGAVTQTQDIDPNLLGEDYSILFIVTVEDDGGAKETTVLEMVLPTAPTTSTTSTTALTTTPSPTTTTTATTTTTTTAPTTTTTTAPTTTTTTTEPPSTTTCTPCETTAPTTWTTPFQTSSTTTESTTVPTTTTTSTTTNPVTTEPVTCEPCTTEVVTCPTIESTTSTTAGGSTTTTVDPLATTTTVDPLATTTTVDPLATTTTTGTQTSTASVGSSLPSSVDPSSSTPSTPTTSDDPPPSSSTAVPQSTTITTTTTTEEPTNPQYKFEFQAYHFQPFTNTNMVGRVRVVQADGQPLGVNVITTYSWASSSESGGFTIDQTTGNIIMKGATEGAYNPVAQAIVDGGAPLLVDVTITVVKTFNCDDTFFISESLITKTVSEIASDVSIANITTLDGTEDKYCITDVVPAQYFGPDYFSVNNQGQLTLGSSIDADPNGGRVVTVRVEAQSDTDPCPKSSSSGNLLRNEVLVQVTIEDANDQTPSLVVPPPGDNPTMVGYPTNRGLQQVVGPVITLKAEDYDTVGSLDFSISGDNANLFVVQTDSATGSGDLYLLDYDACGDQCDVTVTVTDGPNNAKGQQIEVHSLDLSQIYDITVDGMGPEEIEDYVNELSDATDLDLHLLYFSLYNPSPTRRVRRSPLGALEESMVFTKRDATGIKIQSQHLVNGGARTWLNGGPRGRQIQRRDAGFADLDGRDDDSEEEVDGAASTWTSLAHIYGFQADGALVTLEDLNRALAQQQQTVQAKEFSEKATFDPTVEEVSLSGWKAAVGVLGALVGLMLLAALLGFVWYRRRQRKAPASKQGSPQAVSTIGSAYPNHGYKDTEMNRLDSTSTSSEDSVYKNSAFKKAMGKTSGNGAGDTNNNDKPDTGKITNVEVMANPFTSVTVPNSQTYEDPNDSLSPPRDALLLTSASSPQIRTWDSSSYASPVESSAHIYEDSEPQQGGLRRITPGPLLDGARSSPYLTKSDGVYEAFRPSDTDKVASFTPYKGGEGKGSESPSYSSSYKPTYKPEAFSYLDDVPRREVKDTAEKKDKLDSPKKQTKLDTSPYAFPVRTKKEPPNLANAAPAKPIMKNSRDSTLVSTSADVHRSADDPASFSGGFTSLRGSPPPKQRADEREKKSSLKYYTSEGETSDSEMKKSVAFKVLVDEKHIKRRKEDKDKEDEKEKEKEKKKDDDRDDQEVEEETEDL